jgi:hypothetical protein
VSPRTRTRAKAKTTKPAAAPVAENGSGDDEAAKASAAQIRAEQAAAKQAEREKMEGAQLQTLLKRFGEHPAVEGGAGGDESLGAVAKDLNITAGKAAFILMKHAVSEGKVPAIEGKDDESLLKAINTERLSVDRYSAWGWLAARAGKPEGWIKTGLEGLGLYTPGAENIASRRAELNPKPAAEPKAAKTAAKGESKPAPKRRRKGNAS